jgi:hydroxymethylglutaryl-CoA reductase
MWCFSVSRHDSERASRFSGATRSLQIAASVGLAANLGALYTLVSEGVKSIQ